MFSQLFHSIVATSAQPLHSALPRTIAPIASAIGTQSGLVAGGLIGGLMGAFAMDSPKAKVSVAIAITCTTAIAGATAFGFVGYFAGYGGTNLVMAAFPDIKNMESRFLLKQGYKPQVCLYFGVLSFQLVMFLLKNTFQKRR